MLVLAVLVNRSVYVEKQQGKNQGCRCHVSQRMRWLLEKDKPSAKVEQ